MARANYWDHFRFDNKWCDVYQEDDHYLYAQAEYGLYNGFLICNEWHAAKNLHGETEWTRHDTAGADCEYLLTLKPAPEDIARYIVRQEHARTLYYLTRGESCHWYGFEEPPTMSECMEDAEYYAGIID